MSRNWFGNRTFFILSILFLLILPITILVLQDRQTISQHAAMIDPVSGNPTPNGPPGDYHLIFSDEFNGTSLDLSKWIMCNPSFGSSCVPYNNEKELFNTALTNNKNVQVSGGQLHLIALKDGSGDHPYSSGMVSTGPNKWNYAQPNYQSFMFTYGYYEGRVKFPKGNGFWPSLWMLPDQTVVPWPDSGEYDVVEIAGNDPTKGYFTAHWGPNGSGECGHPCSPQIKPIPDASTGFHTYGFDWEQDGLTWYVDGQQMGNKITEAEAIKSTPFYIIANFSVGGDWPPLNGAPDSSTPFPSQVDIDYLRVWQKGAATGPTTAPTTGPTATAIPVPTAVTPTLYCLGEDASEFCSSVTPTTASGVTPGSDVTTTPGEDNPTTEPGDNTEPTTTPCATDSTIATSSTVSVQHRHHHRHHSFDWLLQFLIELINKLIELLGGTGGITLPGTNPCETPTPTEQVTPTEEVTAPVEETITPTTASGVTLAPTTASGVTPTTPATTTTEVKLMPLGDSITDGGDSMGGYRLDLWKKLVQTDGDKIDFVGSLNGGPADLGDKDHEGHEGWNITELDAQVNGWLTTYNPDIILLHIGTNDLDQSASASEMETNLTKLITDIFATKPNVKLVVSSLIVTTVGDNATWTAYNGAIPGIVAQFKNQGKNITYVDMSSALTLTDLDDGAHPTWGGYSKMATVWYPIVTSLYKTMIPN